MRSVRTNVNTTIRRCTRGFVSCRWSHQLFYSLCC